MKETSPRLLFLVLCSRETYTPNFVIKATNLTGQNSPLWSSAISVIQVKQEKQSFCVILQERKRWGLTNYFLYGVFDYGWYDSVKIVAPLFKLLQNSSTKSCFKWSLMRRKCGIYSAVTMKNRLTIQFHISPCNIPL